MENIIKAERLILRPVQKSDLEAVHEYAGDKEITMMMFLPNETKEETEKFIRNSIADWKNENPHDREFVIVYEGKVIGGIDLENCGDGTFEIGWIVNKKYRGLGIASEAASALVDYGFKELGAKKIIAHCDSKNKASEKVMVKIGMKLKDDKGTRVYPKTGVVSGEYLYELENNREKHGEN